MSIPELLAEYPILTKELPAAALLQGFSVEEAMELASLHVHAVDICSCEGAIEDVRRARKFTATRPFASPLKIVIIDGNQLTKPAEQAMLKMLEEPNVRCRVIIVTHRHLSLTVISRCWLVRKRWSTVAIAEVLGSNAPLVENVLLGPEAEAVNVLLPHKNTVVSMLSLALADKLPEAMVLTRKWEPVHISTLRFVLDDLRLSLVGRQRVLNERDIISLRPLLPKIPTLLPILLRSVRPSLCAAYVAAKVGGV